MPDYLDRESPMTPDLVITTARSVSGDVLVRAEEWSRRLGGRVVPRAGRNVPARCEEEGVKGVLVVAVGRETYYEPEAGIEYFFHPNLASMRIRNLESGKPDHLVQAMRLQAGDEVLDCTMGRASDAILCVYAVGEAGHVVAIEKMPVIAHLTIEGLRHEVDLE